MLMHVYTVFDRVLEEAGPIFVSKNHAHAQRLVAQMFKGNPDLKISDYKLLLVGRFNTALALMEAVSPAQEQDILAADTTQLGGAFNA